MYRPILTNSSGCCTYAVVQALRLRANHATKQHFTRAAARAQHLLHTNDHAESLANKPRCELSLHLLSTGTLRERHLLSRRFECCGFWGAVAFGAR